MMTKDAYDFAARKTLYRTVSSDSLRYIATDIRLTLDAWPDHPNAGWYLDDLHTVGDELNRRKRRDTCPHCGK